MSRKINKSDNGKKLYEKPVIKSEKLFDKTPILQCARCPHGEPIDPEGCAATGAPLFYTG